MLTRQKSATLPTLVSKGISKVTMADTYLLYNLHAGTKQY